MSEPGQGILAGRVAIVTGASSGIGRACAVRFADEGARVVGCARRLPELHEMVSEVEASGGEAIAVGCDVASEEAIDRVVATAIERYGKIDILANIAQGGLGEHTDLLGATRGQALDSFITGPLQTLVFMQKCFPHMKAARYGRIINTSSITAIAGTPGFTCYVMAKGAMLALTRNASQEWAEFGIVTNTILPVIRTEQWDSTPELTKAADSLAAGSPLRRIGAPDADCAPVVAFLASEAAGYLNGQAIGVDGGMRLIG
jgi:3-oxoacyl-[acyl-carrier protein] reductase